MRILVTYYSKTGNTEKLARAIYDVLPAEKELVPLTSLQKDIDKEYDIIFCGFPVQAHSVPGRVYTFIKDLSVGKNIVFFCTHGSLRGGPLPRQAIEQALGLASKANVLGAFGCQGQVNSQILDELSEKPEHRAWVEEALSAIGHPDSADLADVKNFALRMIDKVR